MAAKNEKMMVRFEGPEKKLVERAAAREFMRPSTWLRVVALRAATNRDATGKTKKSS